MYNSMGGAMARLEELKAFKLAQEEDKKQCNSPVVEVLHVWEIEK